eukprot:762723-Hanusia_phi.AAC.9
MPAICRGRTMVGMGRRGRMAGEGGMAGVGGEKELDTSSNAKVFPAWRIRQGKSAVRTVGLGEQARGGLQPSHLIQALASCVGTLANERWNAVDGGNPGQTVPDAANTAAKSTEQDETSIWSSNLASARRKGAGDHSENSCDCRDPRRPARGVARAVQASACKASAAASMDVEARDDVAGETAGRRPVQLADFSGYGAEDAGRRRILCEDVY